MNNKKTISHGQMNDFPRDHELHGLLLNNKSAHLLWDRNFEVIHLKLRDGRDITR